MSQVPSAAQLTRILAAGRRRALELEPRYAALLQPLLEAAGDRAARNFSRMATDHLTAAARAGLALTAADLGVTSLSTMICLKPRPEQAALLADPDGEPPESLHVTLVYLGEVEGPLESVAEALRPVAATLAPLAGVVGGYGQFGMPDGGSVGILLPDVPGLVELRVAVTEALVGAEIDYARNHGFEAHLTVDVDPEPDELAEMLPRSGLPLNFDALLLVRGDVEELALPLVGSPSLTAAGEPPGWSAPNRNEILDVEALVKTLRTKTDPVRQAVVETMVGATMEQAGLSFDTVNLLTGRALSESASQIVNISASTQENVMRIVRASYEHGLTIPDTAKAIRVGMREASPARATLIARTELCRVVNTASLDAVKTVSAATGNVYLKEWMTAGGAEWPRHELYDGLDGQTASLDGYFSVGASDMECPGDGPPDEACNCRCAMGYVDGPSAAEEAALLAT